MLFVCKFGLLPVELAKWPLWNQVPFGLNIVYFGIVTTENNNRCEISMVGRSNCGNNSGYFLAGNAVMMLKIKARPGYTRTKGCTSAQEMNKNKKRTEGLNFNGNVDFWFCNDDFCTKKPEGNKPDFCRFSMTLKMVTFVLVQIQMVTFQKAMTFFAFIGYPNLKDSLLNARNWQLRQYSCDWESCNVSKQCSLVWPVLAGMAINGSTLIGIFQYRG